VILSAGSLHDIVLGGVVRGADEDALQAVEQQHEVPPGDVLGGGEAARRLVHHVPLGLVQHQRLLVLLVLSEVVTAIRHSDVPSLQSLNRQLCEFFFDQNIVKIIFLLVIDW